MKLNIFLMLLPILSVAGQSTIWPWKEKADDSLSNPYAQSRVPQFILDTRHPWIIENQSKLERLPNAESYLCFPPKESTSDVERAKPGGRGNGLDMPPDLFDYLEIDNDILDAKRPGWPNALARAQEIRRCPAALSQVKTFKLVIYAPGSEHSDWDKKKVLDLFGDVLGNMTRLETLKWAVPQCDARYFEEHFIERGLTLPSVKRLECSAMSHFLVRMCPNITVLESGRGFVWRDRRCDDGDPEILFVRAAMFASKLTRFAMASWPWTQSTIQGIGFQLDCSKHAEETIQPLSSLQNLTHLDLPDASKLGVGWFGYPGCGNVYFGPEGRQYLLQEIQQEAEAIDRVAALVAEVLPHLTGFTVGNTQANITRYENGTLGASFPWTGRMHEWVMDSSPYESDEID
ncbi:hypothetical protein E0Z10_g5581 [Xylaria hypoxylon]|uniref:Uncharacterized protein n=1 Tax=Xylaria hypoxylon TaxID=37992 RepID=A0A4Z0YFS4_9PEZI|nr:hypothetical protein E0Z10_g5581 [Xylaria hypoxylon]